MFPTRRVSGRPVVSFEFFPPKTQDGERVLFEETLPDLKQLKPDFCSVTYGAGGSTRDKTLEVAERIQNEQALTTMAHLTCVGSTVAQIQAYIDQARRRGIRNILALRGDPPGGAAEFQKTEGGFEFSWQLVTFLRELNLFAIGTAGFPEGHIACKEGKRVDWQRLKAKIDCGANFVVTQLFFDNRDFFEFREFLRHAGVTVPICAGILPILSAGQIRKFTALCGAKLSDDVVAGLNRWGENDAAVAQFGIDYASRQCDELLSAGVDGIHFYTLNKPTAVKAVLHNVKLA
jgi:methylenetetrahydrofolate reductase (NADPH)